MFFFHRYCLLSGNEDNPPSALKDFIDIELLTMDESIEGLFLTVNDILQRKARAGDVVGKEGGAAAALLKNKLVFWLSHPSREFFWHNLSRIPLHISFSGYVIKRGYCEVFKVLTLDHFLFPIRGRTGLSPYRSYGQSMVGKKSLGGSHRPGAAFMCPPTLHCTCG